MFARKSLYFVLPLIAMVLMGCGTVNFGFSSVRGSGTLKTEERAVSMFEKVVIEGSGDLYVVQGNEEGLTIEAEDNLMEYLTSEVRDNTLVLGFKDGVSVSPTKGIRYNLKVKNLSDISVAGSGNIHMDTFKAESLSLSIAGSGDAQIKDLAATSLRIQSSGSGNFEVSGSATKVDVNISGSGKYKAGDLESDDTSITIGGSGEAVVWANISLKVQVSGSGDISYYGDPNVSQSISGSGSVKSLGSK